MSTTVERPVPRTRRPILDLFALDQRSLTVFRIAIAGLVVYDTLGRVVAMPGMETRPSDGPWLPRLMLIPLAVIFGLGIRPRLAAAGCWLIYSLEVRSALFADGAWVPYEHYALTLALLWAALLPLRDRGQERATRTPQAVVSMATVGLIVQVFLIYFSAGMTKYPAEWLVDRTALFDVLSHPNHATALGRLLTDRPGLLAALSVATVALEVMGPLLLLIPGRGIPVRRAAAVGLFVIFHVGLAMTLTLGLFPLVMIAVWMALLPGALWDRLGLGSPDDDTLAFDTRPLTTVIAGTVIVVIVASNLVTWFWFPANEGLPAAIQDLARHLALYQQWTMFSVPSTL